MLLCRGQGTGTRAGCSRSAPASPGSADVGSRLSPLPSRLCRRAGDRDSRGLLPLGPCPAPAAFGCGVLGLAPRHDACAGAGDRDSRGLLPLGPCPGSVGMWGSRLCPSPCGCKGGAREGPGLASGAPARPPLTPHSFCPREGASVAAPRGWTWALGRGRGSRTQGSLGHPEGAYSGLKTLKETPTLQRTLGTCTPDLAASEPHASQPPK